MFVIQDQATFSKCRKRQLLPELYNRLLEKPEVSAEGSGFMLIWEGVEIALLD